jgi:hypothetical protein
MHIEARGRCHSIRKEPSDCVRVRGAGLATKVLADHFEDQEQLKAF